MNFVDWIVIGWPVPMWLLSIQAWRHFQRIRFGLEQRPHERRYWSMRSAIYAGPVWTAYVLVFFVQKLL